MRPGRFECVEQIENNRDTGRIDLKFPMQPGGDSNTM
jgi:hypothetical protein